MQDQAMTLQCKSIFSPHLGLSITFAEANLGFRTIVYLTPVFLWVLGCILCWLHQVVWPVYYRSLSLPLTVDNDTFTPALCMLLVMSLGCPTSSHNDINCLALVKQFLWLDSVHQWFISFSRHLKLLYWQCQCFLFFSVLIMSCILPLMMFLTKAVPRKIPLKKIRFKFCQTSKWRKSVCSVTLTMASLLMPEGLV